MMDESPIRTGVGYRGNYGRLARIKADRDPDDVFRPDRNIRRARKPAS